MAKIDQLVEAMRRNPKDVSFLDLLCVCRHYFGEPRQSKSSHVVFKMPWQGDPRVNIQNNNGRAKLYQVKQVLCAIERLSETDVTEK
jgi:hypothetical protein